MNMPNVGAPNQPPAKKAVLGLTRQVSTLKVTNREVKKNYEVYLALYQAVTGREEWKQIFRQFPADFFDLVVIDECHRGSAADDSAWREVLDYFSSATHIGLTATPKEKSKLDKQKGLRRFRECLLCTLGNGLASGYFWRHVGQQTTHAARRAAQCATAFWTSSEAGGDRCGTRKQLHLCLRARSASGCADR